MASIHDVAKYIIKKTGTITAMKLQKLVYYCQAWSLVWDEKPLFKSKIEAWANGPVAPALYDMHRGAFELSKWPIGESKNLTQDEKDTIDSVLKYYGGKSSQWLSDLTHQELPWKDARSGLMPGERGSTIISHASMAEYYGSL